MWCSLRRASGRQGSRSTLAQHNGKASRGMAGMQRGALFLLSLLASSVLPASVAQQSSCRVLTLQAEASVPGEEQHVAMHLQHGCHRLPEPQPWPSPSQLTITSNITLAAASTPAPDETDNPALSAITWDLGYTAARVALQPGSSLDMHGLVLLGVLMPPPKAKPSESSSGGASLPGVGTDASSPGDPLVAMIAAATAAEAKPWEYWFQPLLPSFMVTEPGSAVRMRNCVVVTLCDTLQQYIDVASDSGSAEHSAGLFFNSTVESGPGYLFVRSHQQGPLTITDTLLTCSPTSPPTAAATAAADSNSSYAQTDTAATSPVLPSHILSRLPALASSHQSLDPSAALSGLVGSAPPFIMAQATAHNNGEMLMATAALSALILPSTLHLRGALNPSSPPWPFGGFTIRKRLVITGDPSPPPGAATVLDFHGLTNIVALVDGAAAEVQNLVILNPCYMAGLINADLNLTIGAAHLHWQFFKPWYIRGLNLTNLTVLADDDELDHVAYWSIILLSPLRKALGHYWYLVRGPVPENVIIAMSSVSETGMVFRFHLGIDSVKQNYTFATPKDPAIKALTRHAANLGATEPVVVPRDPWHCFRPPPEHVAPLSVMRVMNPIIYAQAAASGSPANAAGAPARASIIAPLFKALDLQEFASIHVPSQARAYFPPMLILNSHSTLKGLSSHQTTLGRDLVIFGAMNLDADQLPMVPIPEGVRKPMHDDWVELDLAGEVSAMPMLLGRYSASLYLCRVRLVGLAITSEAQLRLGQRTARTALPLWFLNFVRREPHMALYSVAMELPVTDFVLVRSLALAALAYHKAGGVGLPWRPGGINGTAVQVAPTRSTDIIDAGEAAALEVASGIEEMQVAAVQSERVEILSYKGWGWTGEEVVIVPIRGASVPPLAASLGAEVTWDTVQEAALDPSDVHAKWLTPLMQSSLAAEQRSARKKLKASSADDATGAASGQRSGGGSSGLVAIAIAMVAVAAGAYYAMRGGAAAAKTSAQPQHGMQASSGDASAFVAPAHGKGEGSNYVAGVMDGAGQDFTFNGRTQSSRPVSIATAPSGDGSSIGRPESGAGALSDGPATRSTPGSGPGSDKMATGRRSMAEERKGGPGSGQSHGSGEQPNVAGKSPILSGASAGVGATAEVTAGFPAPEVDSPATKTPGDVTPTKAEDQPAGLRWQPRQAIDALAQSLSQDEADKIMLVSPIGSGACGVVFKGRWRNLDVAVKCVLFAEHQSNASRPEGASSTTEKRLTARERAVMEAAVSVSVNHPNTVSTYHYDIKPLANDFGASIEVAFSLPALNWKLFLVQELCDMSMVQAMDEGLLHRREDNAPRLDLVLALLTDIARGLVYLHSKSIIHGDLKPDNVLLKCDPTSPYGLVAKLTDFGLSQRMDPGRTHVSNNFNGTPFYICPHTLTTGHVTKASDSYSFGVLAWEAYRNIQPFVRARDGTFQVNQSFCQFTLDMPQPLVQLVSSCLKPEPKDRPIIEVVLSGLESMRRALAAGNWTLEEAGSPVARSLGVQLVRAPPPMSASAQPSGAAGGVEGGGGGSQGLGVAGEPPRDGGGEQGPESPTTMDLGRALVLSHSSSEGVGSYT